MIRALTVGEAALARRAVGPEVETDRVRILAAPWPIDRAFVPGPAFGRCWIVWPARMLTDDLSTAPVSVQAVFVHEMVHVWQAQGGVGLLGAKLKAGDGPGAYRYVADDACRWERLNIEQQAMVVEHRFRLSRGGRAPGDAAFYDRVCPLGRAG